MKIKKTLLINIALALLISSLILSLRHTPLFKRIELSSLDLFFHLRGEVAYNPRIVIVEITDNDIEKVGRWPWKRIWSAAMAQALTGLGARSVYFDIIYSEPAEEQDDAVFEEAIKKNQNTYLPLVFESKPYDIADAILPLKRFSDYAKGTGAINIYADMDGTIRRMPLLFETKEGSFPHLSLKAALDYACLEIKENTAHYLALGSAQKNIRVPLIEKNTLLINWLGKWQHTFKHYGFLDVLSGYKNFLENKAEAGNIKLSDFKDSLAIVAVTAVGLYDIKPIPIQSEYPGVGVAATVLSNILDEKFLYPLPGWINIIALYILAVLSSLLILGEKPFRELYFTVSFILFRRGIYSDFSFPLLGLFVSALSVETYNFGRIAVERRNFFKMAVTDGLTGLYNIRYFKMLLETEISLSKHDPENRRFAVVMSDVDHFKNFNDTYGHQIGDLVLKEISSVLKGSMRAADIVSRYGGEEMIMLLRGVNLKDAIMLTEKIRKNIEEHIVKDEKGATYKVTASLGVSTFKVDDSVDSLIKRADDGLYKSKEGGRNCVSSIEDTSG